MRTPLWALVPAGVVAGLAVVALVIAFEPSRYRAESSLVVQRGTQPLAGTAAHGLVRTVRDLARSATVADAVIKNLALHESADAFRNRVHVDEDDDSAVLLLRADAGDRARAQQIVLQLGLVVTQFVRQRFGQASSGAEPVQVTVLDQAHSLPGRVSPDVWRDLGWGALFGLVAGLFAANAAAVRRREQLLLPEPG